MVRKTERIAEPSPKRGKVNGFLSRGRGNQRQLFDRQVASLLMRYIYVHKKYLAASVVMVAVMTAATLAVPYISKIVIDRLIVKQGSIALQRPGRNRRGGSFYHKKDCKGDSSFGECILRHAVRIFFFV